MAGYMLPPGGIKIILHHHCQSAPYEPVSDFYRETVAWAQVNGVLTEDLRTTPLGAALVEAWCRTPLPVVAYIDPRTDEKLA